MSRIHLTESRWAFIEPLLPPPARTGRPRANDRRTLEGILSVLSTGCRWHDVPREYGAPTTVWRRLRRPRRWGEEGVWERIWRSALSALARHGKRDWTMAVRDGSFAPAKNGGDKVGLTKKGKGTKWMLVVDGDGLPLGFHLASASTAEVRLAAQILDTISVARPHDRPTCRPERLVADRAYDSHMLRCALRPAPPRHGHVHPGEASPREVASHTGSSHRRAPGGVSAPLHGGAELRLAGDLPASAHPIAHPLGAPVRRRRELVRGGDHAHAHAHVHPSTRLRGIVSNWQLPPRREGRCSGHGHGWARTPGWRARRVRRAGIPLGPAATSGYQRRPAATESAIAALTAFAGRPLRPES